MQAGRGLTLTDHVDTICSRISALGRYDRSVLSEILNNASSGLISSHLSSELGLKGGGGYSFVEINLK